MSALSRLVVVVGSCVLRAARSFLDSLERVTSPKYVPTDGECRVHLSARAGSLTAPQTTSCARG